MKQTPKNPVGRPKEIDAKLSRYTVTLDDETVAALRKLGMDNISLGVREAIRKLRQIQIV